MNTREVIWICLECGMTNRVTHPHCSECESSYKRQRRQNPYKPLVKTKPHRPLFDVENDYPAHEPKKDSAFVRLALLVMAIVKWASIGVVILVGSFFVYILLKAMMLI